LIERYNDVFKISVVNGSTEIFDQTMLALYTDSNMKYFLNNPIENNFLGIKDINSYFTNIVKTNPLISEVGIFFNKNHLIISSGTVKYDYFYDFYDNIIDSYIKRSEEIMESNTANDFNVYVTGGNMQIVRPLMSAKKVEGINNIISFMTDSNGWRYISVIPEQFYMEPVQFILNNLLICAIVSLVAGMIFIFIMSLWQSRPMKDMEALYFVDAEWAFRLKS